MHRRVTLLLRVVLLILAALPLTTTAQQTEVYFPGETWRTSTPEEQGISSERLAQMLAFIRDQDYPLHSMTIIRHGYVVLDAYFHPYTADTRHNIYSATKSFTSTLVGIAIEQGYLPGIEARLLDLLPELDNDSLDPRVYDITLENLLQMHTGFNCPEVGVPVDDPAWIAFMETLPMADDPGAEFRYCAVASHLLSQVIERATGMSAREFAEAALFAPLGISDVNWPDAPDGHTYGHSEMRLRPHDMARLGYLFLHNGQWAGETIVSPEWVTAATTADENVPGMRWGYGYQWWVMPAGYYAAMGYADQFIMVHPELDMVVVFTKEIGSNPSSTSGLPVTLMDSWISPAVEADNALPANADSTAACAAHLEALAAPAPEPFTLPAFAQTLSGHSCLVDENPDGLESIMVTFDEPAGAAMLDLQYAENELAIPVGLDGVYRLTDVTPALEAYFGAGEALAARGLWRNDTRFVIDFHVVGDVDPQDITIRQDEDGTVNVVLTSIRIEGRSTDRYTCHLE
ncbi:MAG: serine hydrolase [Anaerolineae bacterium]|nr:serine hydrolase [Anaerolineae bacterium]